MRGRYQIVRVVDGRPLVTCRVEDLSMVVEAVPGAMLIDEAELEVARAAGVNVSDDEVILFIKGKFPKAKLRRVEQWYRMQRKQDSGSPGSRSPFLPLLASPRSS